MYVCMYPCIRVYMCMYAWGICMPHASCIRCRRLGMLTQWPAPDPMG